MVRLAADIFKNFHRADFTRWRSAGRVGIMTKPRLSAPPISDDVDLRGFPFMPLEVKRLKESKQWRRARKNPAIGFYSLNLWMAAWHQVPAGSLPDDEEDLADYAWCEMEKWPEVKDQVMRGWEKCSDGRWYHSVLSEKVNEAWGMKHQNKKKTAAATEAARLKKQEKNNGGNPENSSVTEPSRTEELSVTDNVTEPSRSTSRTRRPSVTDPTRHRQGQDIDIEKDSLSSTIGVSTAAREPEPTPGSEPDRTAKPNPDDDGIINSEFITAPVSTEPRHPTRQELIARIQDFKGGLRPATAAARLDGWLNVLSVDDIVQGLDHCRAQGFDRNGVRDYFDAKTKRAAVDRITARRAEKAAALPPPPKENPEWLSVRERVIRECLEAGDKQVGSWIAGDAIQQIHVSGKSAELSLGSRFMANHVEKTYGPKIATVWRELNPEITEICFKVAPPGYRHGDEGRASATVPENRAPGE